MNLLADENIELEIVELLRKDGFNVSYISEISPGVDDQTVIRIANENNSILITSDKDFGELAFRQNLVHDGIILLRLQNYHSKIKADIVVKFIKEHKNKLENSFSVITPKNIRIRAKLN